MNLSPLRPRRASDPLGRLAPTGESSDPGAAIAEYFLLEDCVARCESLADDMAGVEALGPVMVELSECIAACASYLAARSRQSRHVLLLRAYCLEVLTTAASVLARHDATRGSDCHRVIRASVGWLLGRG